MKKKILFGLMACLLFAGCQFDSSSKKEEPEKDTYRLSVVWNNWASEKDYIDTDGTKKIFIADYIYGSKEEKLAEELVVIESYFYSTDLSKYDSEYKEKMSLGDENVEKETVYTFDTNKRYAYSTTNNFVYICSFTYYSDEGLANEIKSVVMDSDKTVYVKAYLDYVNVAKWDNYVNGVTESYK